MTHSRLSICDAGLISKLFFPLAPLVLLLLNPFAHADNWPQWRGPKGDGISAEKSVPVTWSTTQNVVWKTAIPGEGHSSPMVWNDSVFLTTAMPDTGERRLIRLDAKSGKILWQRPVLAAPVEAMHRENSPASSTPITDGTRVYTSFQNGKRADIACYDFAGKRLWSAQPVSFAGEHGYSYTPLLHGDLLIYDFCQNDDSAVIAFDKNTGRIRWRHTRKKKEISHITPIFVNEGGRAQLITCGGDEVRSFDPATGKTLWWCDGPTDVCVAGLCHADGVVFATGGYPKRTRLAVRANGSGNVTATHVVWTTGREVSYVPSPVFADGHLFTVVDDGLLYCFNPKTGKAVWDHRLGGRFRSSLVLADGNIYAANDKGVTTVFRASSAGFQPVAANDLQEFCYTTPAIANGRIFIRTGGNLYCIGHSEGGAK